MEGIKHQVSRRRFLGAMGGVAAAGALGPLAGTAAGKGPETGPQGAGAGSIQNIPDANIGIQLFTVRDLLADNELDLPGTFELLADAGYALVEVGGTYDGRTAAQFRELANAHGLAVGGTHVPGGGNAWRNNRAQIFADAKALGIEYVGLASPPPGTTPTHASYAAIAAEMNQWGAEARAEGLKFYFHNHAGDFALDGGTPVYDTLLAETDPSLVWFEMDLAWVVAGGQDPIEYLRKGGVERFPLFHVKDLTWTAPQAPAGVTQDAPRTTPANVSLPGRPYWLRDVGKGDIDFVSIFKALKDPRNHRYFVEHDDAPADETATSTSPRPRNPAGSANTAWTSAKHLRELRVK